MFQRDALQLITENMIEASSTFHRFDEDLYLLDLLFKNQINIFVLESAFYSTFFLIFN